MRFRQPPLWLQALLYIHLPWPKNCPARARGGGQLVTQQGNYYTLTEALDIAVTPDAGDAKYWSSTGYNSLGEPSKLEADGGVEHNGGGGPYWYAAAEPTQGAAVTLSAEESDGAQRVVLVWKSNY
ncbi:hypothetical protein BO79DRAFT_218450 [Aspergillus costaricaensis CBS 115574]|uniref:Uncharacterized protein n=1 Tax=Aspergillus costaricaensis CBS 115574 TaxID=1448317 RepID=A0ACD1ICM9_9EURO|nr:hypothetical protein BO79DRAFT_218450 [Aspergillus costaricaensis CBS 115574]RAK88107.1 hypothetical protein BO79DRAFT_218450 [Aspergillus costaricaensis CBS 115574]